MIERTVFVSRKSAEATESKQDWSVLSITSPGTTPASIKPGWNSLLRVEFDDIDVDSMQDPTLLKDLEHRYSFFTAELAQTIVQWIKEQEDTKGYLARDNMHSRYSPHCKTLRKVLDEYHAENLKEV